MHVIKKVKLRNQLAPFEDGFNFLIVGKTAIFLDYITGVNFYYAIFVDDVQYVLRRNLPSFLTGDTAFITDLLVDYIKINLEVENVAFTEAEVDKDILKLFN